ncbi:hypothetical protein AOPFMNJM_3166 [Methylobacterium jeotgali]|uniref:Uncharacterized protein n=1 Tax=Methylobacterium jeotgali TaxID=381630 RepID=A0ABQ4SZ68_9HYPH|nr:hypothetical protein AOPFMNJM_3166 [Methylobacterium jeotgali]
MQGRTDAKRTALQRIRDGKPVAPARFCAYRRSGLVDVRGNGKKAKVCLSEAGLRQLAELEA